MKHPIRVALSVAFGFAMTQLAFAAEPIGKVLNAKTAIFSGTTEKRQLEVGDGIFFRDRLTSNETGTGEFVFNDGAKLAIGPSASLVIDEFVQKDQSTFQKLGAAAAKGTFRWISGKSPSAAYRIKTPMGTLGNRGTAYDITNENGVTSIVLLNGAADFCAGRDCRSLRNTGDYITTDGRTISPPRDVRTVFKTKDEVAKVFPFLAIPGLLSPSFQVPGSNLYSDRALRDMRDQGTNEASNNARGGNQGGTNAGGTTTGSTVGVAGAGAIGGLMGAAALMSTLGNEDDEDEDRGISPD